MRSVALTADGRTLATGSDDGTVRLWDVSDPTRPNPLAQPFTGHGHDVRSVALTADGHTLASSTAQQGVLLWDVTAPHPAPQTCPTPHRPHQKRLVGDVRG
ncbi:hypothetical protein I6A60_24540 [Frankia sp. AgB1.9]|uniref:WD40 repeat domain-containing protein n=1 Tax=unclassified Frankia TaxID=2632575 RepID=UPI00193240F2|nr:hypothetical protein [Frankia sp. AgW1.1]MBL7551009.1 hypothetical protein [Frankia sp. AgB1.9]MBL7621210.1 hypothetical protein [Frankia sp. AgB1.8]